ncbi:uncharacterized protein BYT42DRAFT_555932 [Radiomyces spectabilis]|uniref:uncharacterized protein n=1 Tax=Radiomyces spectabilis TaxID=64574 RepID=UPI0022208C6A|nr:uncharacterized protein BYT42DRAFT_555932 [Radiomyces spectabilis]KAI8391181.1 hypothetical protein BYT42DRAFT_555932 [Radiomyces spectabilis]
MPLLVMHRLATRLSTYFYGYGKLCASHSLILLFFSLACVCFLSLPVITNVIHAHTHTFTIPTSHLDAKLWQFSPHVHSIDHSSNSLRAPSMIAQQIHLMIPEQTITTELLSETMKLRDALQSVTVNVNGKQQSLRSICVTHHGQCIIHSPLDYWTSSSDLLQDTAWPTTISRRQHAISQTSGLLLHPFSLFANVTMSAQNQWIDAESIIMTVLIQPSPFFDAQHIWDLLWQHATEYVGLKHHRDSINFQTSSSSIPRGWYDQLLLPPHTLQFKYQLFPYAVPPEIYVSIGACIATFYMVSAAFGRSKLVRSQYLFGLAAVFLSIACFTTTLGILHYLDIELTRLPWYLLPVVACVATLENVFLLTNAVLDAGCDMHVKEKVARGMQSVGLPMMATLIAEMGILAIGGSMEKPLVKEFCFFAKLLLLVEYALQMTFFVAILTIDVKRVELADLNDNKVSKRIRELSKYDGDVGDDPDFCPVQDTPDELQSKSCAECKEFKTHRAFNALILCLVLLALSVFCSHSDYPLPTAVTMPPKPSSTMHKLLISISSRFWRTVNPSHDMQSLVVNAPFMVIFSEDVERSSAVLLQHEALYPPVATAWSASDSLTNDHTSSVFRHVSFLFIQYASALAVRINIPSVLLCIVLAGIMIWMSPYYRNRWLIPLLKHLFVKATLQLLLCIQKIVPSWSSAILERTTLRISEYDKDGVHFGAISAQKLFNQQQQRSVQTVTVQTLSGKHVADLRQIGVSGKCTTIVSSGQDGRVVLWDPQRGDWMARLDRCYQTANGKIQAQLNTAYYRGGRKKPTLSLDAPAQQKTIKSARCVQIDKSNQWLAIASDEAVLQLWEISTGTLIREIDMQSAMPVADLPEEQNAQDGLRRRRATLPKGEKPRTSRDRVMAISFLDTLTMKTADTLGDGRSSPIAEEPLLPQTSVVVVFKSGVLQEWDILSGACTQSIVTQHGRNVKLLHVVENRSSKPTDTQWIFTASKNGIVRSWERKLVDCADSGAETDSTDDTCPVPTSRIQWHCRYVIDGHNHESIVALASENSAGSAGIVVTGASDGALKVWGFDTGDHVLTLCQGGVKKTHPEIHAGGPLLRFSKFATNSTAHRDNDDQYREPGQPLHSAVAEIVVARYCDATEGPGSHPSHERCLGSGFIVACSSMDDTVHVWRLDRPQGVHDKSCQPYSKDYRRQQIKRSRKPSMSLQASSEDALSDPRSSRQRRRLASMSNGTNGTNKRRIRVVRSQLTLKEDEVTDLLDIEQLATAQENDAALEPIFLGKIQQFAGRGLVFCDNMVLAGVRQRLQDEHETHIQWEAWFASLRYREAPDSDTTIPVETFNLEVDKKEVPEKRQATTALWPLFQQLLHLLLPTPTSTNRRSALHRLKSSKPKRLRSSFMHNEDSSSHDQDMEEANEILPFAVIRHVLPLNGNGVICDFGNFIKVVSIDNSTTIPSEKGESPSLDREVDQARESITAIQPRNGHITLDDGRQDFPPIEGRLGYSGGTVCNPRNKANCVLKANCARAADCAGAPTSFGRQ